MQGGDGQIDETNIKSGLKTKSEGGSKEKKGRGEGDWRGRGTTTVSFSLIGKSREKNKIRVLKFRERLHHVF
ncbi:hypothetical protein CsSME_00046414 [Camellia sinensis var. sinensis]